MDRKPGMGFVDNRKIFAFANQTNHQSSIIYLAAWALYLLNSIYTKKNDLKKNIKHQ
jgi:hypothetical protein